MITFNQNFYFYTSIPGQDLLLIVEVITQSDINKCDKVCGWIFVPLVTTDEKESILKSSITYKLPLLTGTSKALVVLKDGSKGINTARHSSGMEISLTLSAHPVLLQLTHLVPENILIDATYNIPGLMPVPPEILNSGGYIFKPRLQKCITFQLERLCIKVQPSLEAAEKDIVEKIKAEHEAGGSSFEMTSKASIVQRRLQVAVYNGYCFIQEPDFYHLLVESVMSPSTENTHRRSSSIGSINFSREFGLILRSDVKLPNVPDDSNIAIAFSVEYVISLPSSSQSQIISSVNKSPTSNVSIAWGFLLLRDLKSKLSHSIKLTSDPVNSPHKILYLRTSNEYNLSFDSYFLSKQSKNSSASVLSATNSKSIESTPIQTHQPVEESYFSSPVQKSSGPKHKSVGDIPMTVLKGEVGCPRTYISDDKVNENNMNLQEVMLVSSSLPLVPPMLHSFPHDSGVSHKTFTKLYWDKLQPILDHNGKPAVPIDNTVPYNVDKNRELHSPPQRNECFLQFLALSGLEEYSEKPEQLFFTFQFYRFPSVRSESLSLKPLFENENNSSPVSSMVYALHNPRERDTTPGFQVVYNVDPSELDEGEYKPFLFHLMKHSLHVDLWNGESLLYFGTVAIPLKYLCRQGKEAVYAFLELDIINCEFVDESLTHTALPTKSAKGKLHVRLASIRHPLSAKALEKFEDNNVSSEAIIINSKNEATKSELHSGKIVSARPIVETNKELSRLLASRCILNNTQNKQNGCSSEEQRRKLARMAAVRDSLLGKNASHEKDESMKNYIKERQRDILSIESYIQKNKCEMIQSLLHSSITSERVVYPVLGSKLFFEFVIENPFPVAKTIEITWKCSELSLVTDFKIWKKLRAMHNLSQNVDQLSFNTSKSEVPSILLQPREKTNIPFTYHCSEVQTSSLDIFKTASGHHFTADLLSSAPLSNNLSPSSAKIRFVTEEQTLLALLFLKIQPLLPSVTHVLKFLSMEHSLFKKSIRINVESSSKHKLTVKSSDAEVVCGIQEIQDWEEDINVYIKAPTRAAGTSKEFYLFIYKDPHQIIPYQTWVLSIHPMQRIDLSCIAGQLMRSSLLIRGTHATNLVKCCSSSSDLQLHPSDPFVLSPFAIQELSMNVRSLFPGTKYFQIIMVNQSLEQALQSWLLVLSCQKPSISKAFQVHLSIGKEATKRITYTNPYQQNRTFVLHCSHPRLLRLREWKFTVPPGKSYCIGLYFSPQQFVFTETLFLYLNDIGDKNEETYCIKVICQ